MTALLLGMLVAVSAGVDSTGSSGVLPENRMPKYSAFLAGYADGEWKGGSPVVDSTGFYAGFAVEFSSRVVDMLGVISGENSGGASLERGRALVRWPGTPWIGGGVRFGEGQPFLPGLEKPVVDWDRYPADSITGFQVSGGGIMGFEAAYLLQEARGDTLEQFSVFSPWMGFLGADYRRLAVEDPDSSSGGNTLLNVLEVRTDFKYVRPRMVISVGDGEPGRWVIEGEIRGFAPFDTYLGPVELVPGVRFSGDSADVLDPSFSPGGKGVFMGTYLQSRKYLFAAGLEGVVDVDNGSVSVEAGAGTVMEGGMDADISLEVTDGDFRGVLGVGVSDESASIGIDFTAVDDSTRMMVSSSYSPRRDVCARVSVSGDLAGTVDSRCAADVSAMLGPVLGVVGVEWEHGSLPVFRIDVRGIFR